MNSEDGLDDKQREVNMEQINVFQALMELEDILLAPKPKPKEDEHSQQLPQDEEDKQIKKKDEVRQIKKKKKVSQNAAQLLDYLFAQMKFGEKQRKNTKIMGEISQRKFHNMFGL